MRDLKYIIIFLIIIIFSGLGVSSYKEGIDCHNGTYDSNGLCCAKDQVNNNNGKCIPKNKSTIDSNSIQNPNTIYVILILIILIVWLVIIKQE